MTLFTMLPRALLAAAVLGLGACSATFKTDYPAPVSRDATASWRLKDVQVVVPAALTVSEQASVFPTADIVWREDKGMDRKAQIAKIIDDAATAGAQGLSGSRPVILRLTVARFHALTFEAEALKYQGVGVHNIIFTAEVIDAATGAVLTGPTTIDAQIPGYTGAEAVAKRKAGITQKVLISSEVKRVIAGWLNLGPDPRNEFTRIGG
ncbi:MAG: DUF6778 family protein [Deltaproteobacteria bacterium]